MLTASIERFRSIGVTISANRFQAIESLFSSSKFTKFSMNDTPPLRGEVRFDPIRLTVNRRGHLLITGLWLPQPVLLLAFKPASQSPDIKTQYIGQVSSECSFRFYRTLRKSTRSLFSCSVSLSSWTKLKNSTVSSRVSNRLSWR